MESAAHYRALVEARDEQNKRLRSHRFDDAYWNRRVGTFAQDPKRPMDRNLSAVAALLQPDDVLLDVGGGAGRMSLPLAACCKEVINVEPAPVMCSAFRELAEKSGINNARAVEAAWMDDHGQTGDVSLVANVTYFVADIVPFIEKLVASTRRRVIISVWSTPPPDRNAKAHELALSEPLARTPNHRDLLPVLWDLGILPEVQVLPESFPGTAPMNITRSDALKMIVQGLEIRDGGEAARRLGDHFDELYRFEPGQGLRPLYLPDARELLITWTV